MGYIVKPFTNATLEKKVAKIMRNYFGSTGFDYASGPGPTGGFGGRVIDVAASANSSTEALVRVVPEPATWVQLLAGLAPLAIKRKGH